MQAKDTIENLAEYIRSDLKKSSKFEYLIPSKIILITLFDTLFFASMNSEEGELIKVRIAFYDPKSSESLKRSNQIERFNFIPFEKPIPYGINAIVKLSKSADPWSSSLAVFYDEEDNLIIHGLIDQAVHSESFFNRETSSRPDQAGFFQVSIIGIGSLSVIKGYELIATFKQNVLVTDFLDVLRFGPISKLLRNKSAAFIPGIDKFIQSNNFKVDIADYESDAVNIWRDTISRILIHIRNYHHGGAFLITPETKGLRINYPIEYNRLSRSMSRIIKWKIASDIVEEEINELDGKKISSGLFDEYRFGVDKKKSTENELKGSIRFIASHSCVDGLILFDNSLNEKGYGVIIEEIDPPEYYYQANDNTGSEAKLEPKLSKQFGTRHQSMISFCNTNPDSIGFVISQDGDIRVFTKVGEKLIMWENIKTQKYFRTPVLRKTPTTKLKAL